MCKPMLVFALAFIASVASPLSAQSKTKWLPIWNHLNKTKAEVVASVEAGCKKPDYNASCSQLWGSLRKVDTLYVPNSYDNASLVSYIRGLEVKTCGEGRALFSVYVSVLGEIVFADVRDFITGEHPEVCLWSHGRPVLSLRCGNAVLGFVNIVHQELSLNVPNVFKDSLLWIRDSLRSLKDKKQYIHLEALDSVFLEWNGFKGFIHGSKVIDSSKVRLDLMIIVSKPVKRDTVWMPAVHDTVFKSKPLLPFLGGVVIGGLGGYFVHHTNSCTAVPGGGPVNPPNMRAPNTGPEIGFILRFWHR